MPALPTLIDICSALGTGADSILAVYIASDTPIRWTPLAEKLGGPDLEKQHKIEAILNCLIETIQFPIVKNQERIVAPLVSYSMKFFLDITYTMNHFVEFAFYIQEYFSLQQYDEVFSHGLA